MGGQLSKTFVGLSKMLRPESSGIGPEECGAVVGGVEVTVAVGQSVGEADGASVVTSSVAPGVTVTVSVAQSVAEADGDELVSLGDALLSPGEVLVWGGAVDLPASGLGDGVREGGGVREGVGFREGVGVCEGVGVTRAGGGTLWS